MAMGVLTTSACMAVTFSSTAVMSSSHCGMLACRKVNDFTMSDMAGRRAQQRRVELGVGGNGAEAGGPARAQGTVGEAVGDGQVNAAASASEQ
jgi:hypothetical protein